MKSGMQSVVMTLSSSTLTVHARGRSHRSAHKTSQESSHSWPVEMSLAPFVFGKAILIVLVLSVFFLAAPVAQAQIVPNIDPTCDPNCNTPPNPPPPSGSI